MKIQESANYIFPLHIKRHMSNLPQIVFEVTDACNPPYHEN